MVITSLDRKNEEDYSQYIVSNKGYTVYSHTEIITTYCLQEITDIRDILMTNLFIFIFQVIYSNPNQTDEHSN